MEISETAYCRFCAMAKGSNKLLNLQTDKKKYDEIIIKLNFLNAIYVDVTNIDTLPKTICLVCYESLNKAYDFLDSVKRAQDSLIHIFMSNDDKGQCNLSDNDVFDDFLPSDGTEEATTVKVEIPAIDKQHELPLINTSLEIKSEPNEEDANCPYEQTVMINVRDIIEAAMCNVPITSNVEIYAKEVTDIHKKVIKSWIDYPWVCAYCNIEFINIDMLRLHTRGVHGKCSALFCIDCKEGHKDDFSSFIKHVRKHRKILRNYCHYCNILLGKTENIKTHVKQHFQNYQLPCPLCGEILKNEECLKDHLADYASVKRKRQPRRKPGTPITIQELTCEFCKKVYKNLNSLRDHMKLHTIDRKRNYTCDRCGKTFFNKGTLTSHIMSHEKIRPHVCRICNKSFLYPNMLRRHVEMHSGIKPFSCEQCGRCFRLQYQLNTHKIVHTDLMPYVCQYCNRAFRFKQILRNHERQHTGAKPYSCQNCGMEFTNWSNYNKHMKRRHGTDTSKKKITPEGVFPINPETGQIIQVQDPVGTAEWKSRIMEPGKRGKKKVIKQENVA